MTDAYSTRKISPKQQAKHDKYLARALSKYGSEAFDYSQARFYHSLADTTIICKKCLKAFKTSAYLHTRPAGGGCPHCKRIKRDVAALHNMGVRARKNKTMFGRLCKNHSTAFTYTNVRAAGSLAEATCKHCSNTNTVKTSEHTKRPTCKSCGLGSKGIVENIKHKEYLRRALKRHGDKYDFSRAFMKSSTAKVEVTCNTCGTKTKQTVTNIIHNSDGCRQCYHNSRKMSFDEFLSRTNEAHNYKYSYEQGAFESLESTVSASCPTHGVFSKKAKDHLNHGCPECGKLLVGWSRTRFKALCDKNKGALLYVISCFNGIESFFKIGITSNDLETRFGKAGYMPYSFEALYEIKGEAGYIYDLEVRLHALLKEARYEPKIEFGGHTECFTTIKPIEPLLKELTTTEQMQLIA